MPVHQLGQLEGYKQFSDWSNDAWQMGIPAQRNSLKGVNCYTTTEYTADPVSRFAGYICISRV